MDPLASLRAAGLTFRVRQDGKLGVSPSPSPEQAALIREHRDTILADLEAESTWDARTDALASRAMDENPFSGDPGAEEPSILLDLYPDGKGWLGSDDPLRPGDGGRYLAISPSRLAMVESMSRYARETQDKEEHQPGRKK